MSVRPTKNLTPFDILIDDTISNYRSLPPRSLNLSFYKALSTSIASHQLFTIPQQLEAFRTAQSILFGSHTRTHTPPRSP